MISGAPANDSSNSAPGNQSAPPSRGKNRLNFVLEFCLLKDYDNFV